MSNSGVCKSTRVRFTYNDDLAFLKEFLAHNHMQNIDGWEVIQRNLELITRKKFQIRTLKHHLQLLIEIWLKKDEVDKIRSGVEELVSEKDTLLQEISALCSEYSFSSKRKRPISKEKQISELGKKARNKYASIFFNNVEVDKNEPENETNCETTTPIFEFQDHNYVNSEEISFNIIDEEEVYTNNRDGEIISQITVPSKNINSASDTIPKGNEDRDNDSTPSKSLRKSGNNILGPARKRLKKRDPIRKNALSYLSEKNERENEWKNKELELEKKKLAIEERKLDLAERKYELDKQRLEIECKERLQKIDLEKERAQIELHEKKISVHLLQSQQKLIDSILNKN